MFNFLKAYPNCKPLFIVRHPVQSLESWMLTVRNNFNEDKWYKLAGFFGEMVSILNSPLNRNAKGVKLEDIKSYPEGTMRKIAEWMGIGDHPSLYKTEFCGLKYWGPEPTSSGVISGFDKTAIKQPIGRLFGERDAQIFETLFWPFSKHFSYTKSSEEEFKIQLEAIEPLIAEPLEFERSLYDSMEDKSLSLEQQPGFELLHNYLRYAWKLLAEEGTYSGMMEPLSITHENSAV